MSKYVSHKKKRDYDVELTWKQHRCVEELAIPALKVAMKEHLLKHGCAAADEKPKWPQFDYKDIDLICVLRAVLEKGKMSINEHRQCRITVEKMFGNNFPLNDALWSQKMIDQLAEYKTPFSNIFDV